jgi:hypothetical protein
VIGPPSIPLEAIELVKERYGGNYILESTILIIDHESIIVCYEESLDGVPVSVCSDANRKRKGWWHQWVSEFVTQYWFLNVL